MITTPRRGNDLYYKDFGVLTWKRRFAPNKDPLPWRA